jgi:hypothetical protein
MSKTVPRVSSEHSLIGFSSSSTPEGLQIWATCICGMKLESIGEDRAAASDQLWQVFSQHKTEPRRTSLHSQPQQSKEERKQEEKEKKLKEKMEKKKERDEQRKKEKREKRRKEKERKEFEEYFSLELPRDHRLKRRPVMAPPSAVANIGQWKSITYEQLTQIATNIQYGRTNLSRSARELGICRQTLAEALRKANLGTARVYDLEERFWCSIIVSEDSACWVWNGLVISDLPHFRFGGENINVRRYAWSLEHGPLKKCEKVWVTCGNPLCVNPDHLQKR